jgi:uncharacterized coiled-coil DUF342 family protein
MYIRYQEGVLVNKEVDDLVKKFSRLYPDVKELPTELKALLETMPKKPRRVTKEEEKRRL